MTLVKAIYEAWYRSCELGEDKVFIQAMCSLVYMQVPSESSVMEAGSRIWNRGPMCRVASMVKPTGGPTTLRCVYSKIQ